MSVTVKYGSGEAVSKEVNGATGDIYLGSTKLGTLTSVTGSKVATLPTANQYMSANITLDNMTLETAGKYMSGDIVITNVPTVVTIPSSPSAKTYSGSSQGCGISAPSGTTMSGATSATNAGSYSVTLSLNNKFNYVWSDGTTTDKTIGWTINKLSLTIPSLSSASKDYSGSSQSPTVNNFNGSWETQSGTTSATNAGSYAVYWELKDTSNLQWSDGSTSTKSGGWTINRVPVSYTAPVNASPTYNGSSQYIMTAGSVSGGTLYYRFSWTSWSTGRPAATDAGSWDCYWYIEPDGNHTGIGETYCWCNLNKAAGSCSGGYNLSPTYNGTEQALIAGCTGTGTIEYSIDQSYWYTDTPSTTSVASYTIYYRAKESGNYTVSASKSVWCNMNRASVGGKPSGTTLNYTGGSRSPYSVPGGVSAWGTTSAVDGGNYTAYYAPDGNHCWSDGGTDTVTVDWTIQYVWNVYTISTSYSWNTRSCDFAYDCGPQEAVYYASSINSTPTSDYVFGQLVNPSTVEAQNVFPTALGQYVWFKNRSDCLYLNDYITYSSSYYYVRGFGAEYTIQTNQNKGSYVGQKTATWIDAHPYDGPEGGVYWYTHAW